MKRIFLSVLLIIPVFAFPKSGIWFSFKTGFPIAGSSIGLKLGPLAPYGGIDIVRISGSFEDSGDSWARDYDWYNDTYGPWYKESEYSSTFEGSATLFMPNVGLRFYLKQQTLKLYVKGDLTLIIPSVNGRDKGNEIDYNSDGSIDWIDSWDNSLSDSDKKDINDALSYMILAPGIGVEYPFSGHFSVGGEFGFRLITNSFERSDSSEDDYYRDLWKTKVSTTLGMSYTSISLNYIL